MRFPSTTRARLAAIAAAALLLSGCMTEMVESKRPRKGPVAAVGYVDLGGGEVRYSVEGWGIVVALRRSSALRRVNRFCKKDLEPKIVDEFTHDDVDTPYAGMEAEEDIPKGLEHYHVAPYHHILFECRAKPGVVTVDDIAAAEEKKKAPPPAPPSSAAPAPQTPNAGATPK